MLLNMQNGHRNNQQSWTEPQDFNKKKCSKNMQKHMHTNCIKGTTTLP